MLWCPEIELLTIIDNLSSNTSFPLCNDLCLPMKPLIWYWIQVMFPKPPAIISSINLPSQSPCIGSSASCWRGQSVAHGDQKPFPNPLQTRPQTPVNSWPTSTEESKSIIRNDVPKIDTETPNKNTMCSFPNTLTHSVRLFSCKFLLSIWSCSFSCLNCCLNL